MGPLASDRPLLLHIPATQVTYPKPKVTQQQVLSEPLVFWEALRELHIHLGSPLRVPIVSGNELDLYVFYKQVCLPVAAL